MIDDAALSKACASLWDSTKGRVLHIPPCDEATRSTQEQAFQRICEEAKTIQEDEVMKLLSPFLDLSWMSDAQQKRFTSCTTRFVQDARAFDTSLQETEIFQALRNMWIIWMLEICFEKQIVYHSAMFGYSMLYPYSDNILDDESRITEEKQAFNTWFMERLHHPVSPCVLHVSEKVDALVACMEKQYARQAYSDVYQSLYLIQEGQQRSLKQHSSISKKEALDISIFKGGASVLADGYLIDGDLTLSQQQFCVNFGFALQVADDLQDVKEDQQRSHHTLATLCKSQLQRKRLLEKLWVFLDRVVQEAVEREDIRSFIVKNCRHMLILSILQNETYYPASFVKEVKEAMPFSTTQLADMKRTLIQALQGRCEIAAHATLQGQE